MRIRAVVLAAFLAVLAGTGEPPPAGAQGTPVEIHTFLAITGFNAFIGSAYAQTLKIVETIPTGQQESHMLAITHDGRRGYTSNVGAGTVSALDLEANGYAQYQEEAA